MGLLIHIVLVFHCSDETQALAPRPQELQPQSLVVRIILKNFGKTDGNCLSYETEPSNPNSLPVYLRFSFTVHSLEEERGCTM